MYNQEITYLAEKSKSKPYAYKDEFENEDELNMLELKQQNSKLKKILKQAQTKRSMITKQCSQLNKTIQRLQNENQQLKSMMHEKQQRNEGEKYRWEQLRFLNKQLSSQIQELRSQNDEVSQKLRYSSQILQRKYEQLEEKTYKRMEQCVKRVKKTIHYLQNLSIKDLEKTREILIDNLRKSIELLRGKAYEQFNCEGQIEELMNPLKHMQEQITQRTKEANSLKIENTKLIEEINKYKGIQKDQIPIFKEAIEKLKKNLVQVRGQLSENEYQKLQLKKKYEQRIKQSEYKYNQIFKECRKIKLEKKIYENKLEELEADVEEEKQRLQGENQMLKRLYNNREESNSSRISKVSDRKATLTWKEKKTEQKRGLIKNYSNNELKTSTVHIKNSLNQYEQEGKMGVQISEYNEETSMLSQQNLKQQICRIDEQIMQIQKNLTKELEAYH